MIQNIVFDMGGVLLDYNPAKFLLQHDLSSEDRALLLREVFSSYEWIQLDRGIVTYAEAEESMCKRLPERLHSECRYFVEEWWRGPIDPIEGMGELMRELSEKGYPIYILSNAAHTLRSYIDRIPGTQYAPNRFISAEWKCVKPEKEIYDTFVKTYGLKAEECIFIDDNPANVEGAIRAGMHSVVFYRDVTRLRRQLNDVLEKKISE